VRSHRTRAGAYRAPVRILAAIGALFLPLLGARGASSHDLGRSDAPILSQPGFWTLARLGYDGSRVPVSQPLNLIRFPFRLPAGVAERSRNCYRVRSLGRRTCFVIHFHFRIKFAPDSPPGHVYVSAATNRFTASQVLFEVQRPDGRMSIPWSTLNLVRGYEPHTSATPDIDVQDVNFIQTRGLRPGLNNLDFQLEVPEEAVVREVEVFRDSGLEWTTVGPGRVTFGVSASTRRPRVGQRLRVSYVVRRASGRPPENVSVAAATNTSVLRSSGQSSRSLGRITGTVRGAFVFTAIRPGAATIALHLRTGTSRPTRTVRVHVVRS
jgi:hypothetical protein